MTEAINYIPNRVRNAAVGGHVCGSVDIIDDDLGLKQSSINEDVAPMPYNDGNPNGMGRIILKKTDNFKSVVEAQSGNTIFIIKYDFTLTGNVTIPANCVLQFEGGSISGAYTITGNNTDIVAHIIKIFNHNILFAGIWNVINTYSEWFGAKADGVTDDINSIQAAVEFARFTKGHTVKLLKGKYIVSKPIILWASKHDLSAWQVGQDDVFCTSVNLIGSGIKNTIIRKNTQTPSTLQDNNVDSVIIIASEIYKEGYVSPEINMDYNTICYNVKVDGFTIWGNEGNAYNDTEHYCGYGIYTHGVFHSSISNINIFRCRTGIFCYSFSCYTYFTNIECNFTVIGIQILPFSGGMTTTIFTNCHMNGVFDKCYYIRGGGIFIGCSTDGGMATTFYLPRHVLQENTILCARLEIINCHVETTTGAFMYIEAGRVNIINSSILSPSERDIPAITAKHNASVTIIDSLSGGMSGKGYSFAQIESGAYIHVDDNIISNCGFKNYTKIWYNERIKEILNPSTPVTKFYSYINPGATTYPELTVTNTNNQLNLHLVNNDGGEMVMQIPNKVDLTDYQYVDIIASLPGSASGSRFALYLTDDAYEDGYHLNPGSEVPHTLVGPSDEYEYDTFTNHHFRFNVSAISGEKYIGIMFTTTNASGERDATVFDGYLIK